MHFIEFPTLMPLFLKIFSPDERFVFYTIAQSVQHRPDHAVHHRGVPRQDRAGDGTGGGRGQRRGAGSEQLVTTQIMVI